MAQCGLEELDSIASMNSLRELYVSYNAISDISPCSMLDRLQVLDLEGSVGGRTQLFLTSHFDSECPILEIFRSKHPTGCCYHPDNVCYLVGFIMQTNL